MAADLIEIYAEKAADELLVAHRTRNAIRHYFPSVVVLVGTLVLWELLVWGLNIQTFLLPAPRAIAATFAERYNTLISYGLFTFREALAGFAIGCGLGVLVAMIAIRWHSLANVLVPFAVATNSVPIIAFAPIFMVWFGIEEASKIAIVSIMCFFPTMISTFKGLTSAAPSSLELMRSYAASSQDVFLKLRLPSALPFMFNAFKVCATLSMIGAVVGEFFGGPIKALGVFIQSEAALFHTREAWSAIIVACALGIAFYLVITLVERVVMPWHVAYRSNL